MESNTQGDAQGTGNLSKELQGSKEGQTNRMEISPEVQVKLYEAIAKIQEDKGSPATII